MFVIDWMLLSQTKGHLKWGNVHLFLKFTQLYNVDLWILFHRDNVMDMKPVGVAIVQIKHTHNIYIKKTVVSLKHTSYWSRLREYHSG